MMFPSIQSVRLTAGAALLISGAILLAGCGQPRKTTEVSAKSPAGETKPVAKTETAKTTAGHTHSHEEWWCGEHGVPEDVCGQCNPKLAAEFKKNKDWCAMHNRPDSQCFVCHPELEEQFAAKYEAHYGHKLKK